MSKTLQNVLIVGFAIVAHLTAYLQQRLNLIDYRTLPPQWPGQFSFLVALSLLLAVITFLYRDRRSLIRVTLLIRAGILILAGLPSGGYPGIAMALLSALVIETFNYCSIPGSMLFTLLLLGVTAALQQIKLKAWGMILPSASVQDTAQYLGFMLMFILCSAIVRYHCDSRLSAAELSRWLDETTSQLADANFRLQEYATNSEAETKKQLAREIHDSLAHTLTNLVMMLEAAINMSSTGGNTLTQHLKRARDQTKAGLADIRKLVATIRPAPTAKKSGLTAIYRLVHTFTSATRIQVKLNLGDAPAHFGEEADWTAYRLVQEGLTNALRHGKATLIEVSFYRERDGVRIQIKDNGKSLAQTPQAGYGLTGMRERVERLGGNLSFGYETGRGFKVSVWLPLKEG
jgi:signal transduction histidine kinase